MSDELKSKLKDLVYECDLETIKGATARFIRDVAEYHKKHGFLTPAQAEAIIKIHKETF